MIQTRKNNNFTYNTRRRTSQYQKHFLELKQKKLEGIINNSQRKVHRRRRILRKNATKANKTIIINKSLARFFRV